MAARLFTSMSLEAAGRRPDAAGRALEFEAAKQTVATPCTHSSAELAGIRVPDSAQNVLQMVRLPTVVQVALRGVLVGMGVSKRTAERLASISCFLPTILTAMSLHQAGLGEQARDARAIRQIAWRGHGKDREAHSVHKGSRCRRWRAGRPDGRPGRGPRLPGAVGIPISGEPAQYSSNAATAISGRFKRAS